VTDEVHLPVARVAVDSGLAHLDRPFDYAVPGAMAEAAQPGVRVRVRFAGRLVDGWVLERADATEHTGALASLHGVVSAEPVLSPEIAVLARAIADRCAGSLPDVLRLALPPRHARVEAEPPPEPGRTPARPSRAAGSAIPRDPPSSPRWSRGVPPGRSGRRCPARPGRPSWPWRCRPAPPAAGAPSWSCRTPVTSTGSPPP